MIAFLTSLLLFVFGLGAIGQPPIDATEILARIEASISDVEAPEGEPVASYQNGLVEAEEHTDLPDSVTPGASGSQETPQGTSTNAVGSGQSQGSEPNTEKTSAYNSSSGTVIGSVSQVAVDRSPVLLSCDDPDTACDSPDEPPVIPDPQPPCVAPPPCVYGHPVCLLPEPVGGWCEPIPWPLPEPTPEPQPTPTEPPWQRWPANPPGDCQPYPGHPFSEGVVQSDVSIVCPLL